MIKTIILNKFVVDEDRFSSDSVVKQSRNKGWSYSFVYDFQELRDVFLVVKQNGVKNLPSFWGLCKDLELYYSKTRWTKRRLLEYLNALINFGLIDKQHRIKNNIFQSENYGQPIDAEEKKTFTNIFFSYIRFREFLSWFLDDRARETNHDVTEEYYRQFSKPLFCFSSGNSRFTDSFFTDLIQEPVVRVIPKEHSEVMRFWDVFIKWGKTLGVLEKINLSSLHYNFQPKKSMSCVYILQSGRVDIDILDYIVNSNMGDYIYIPQLVFDIAKMTRLSIGDIQARLINQYKQNKDKVSFERTSEIFVKKSNIKPDEILLFPSYNGSYISHMRIRK